MFCEVVRTYLAGYNSREITPAADLDFLLAHVEHHLRRERPQGQPAQDFKLANAVRKLSGVFADSRCHCFLGPSKAIVAASWQPA